MFGLGPTEIIVIAVILIVLFGPKRLPELGSGLGEGIKNFRKSFRDHGTLDVTPKEEDPSAAKPAEGDASKSGAKSGQTK